MRQLAMELDLSSSEFDAESSEFLLRDKKIKSVLAEFGTTTKPCPRPGCPGLLKARSPTEMETQCESCHASYCYACHTPFHTRRGCDQAEIAVARWRKFLESVSADTSVSTYDESTREAIRAKLVELAGTNDNLRADVEAGLVKRCPNLSCGRIIRNPDVECGKIKCGGNYHSNTFNSKLGCGQVWDWRAQPALTVEDESLRGELDGHAVDEISLNYGSIISNYKYFYRCTSYF